MGAYPRMGRAVAAADGTQPAAPSRAELAGLTVALTAYNGALNLAPLPDPLYVPANLTLTAALLYGLGHRWGLRPADLGLARGGLIPGLVVGGAVVGLAGLGLLAALDVPAAQPLLADARAAGLAGASLAYYTLVRIPLGTAVTEEVIFRGVLLEGCARRMGLPAAVATSSVAFGLWHIGPTLRLLELNAVDTGPVGTLLAVAGTVLATTAAGVGFALLRRWGRGLFAPITAHAGINAASLLAAVAAQRGA